MLLHSAIVPPRAVLDAVVGVVREAERSFPVEPPPPPPEPEPRRRLLGRLGRPTAAPVEPAEPPAPPPPLLEYLPGDDLQLPITGFGNVTPTDAHALAEVLAEAAVGWSPATVRFSGGTALDFPGDPCVWARLEGDLDGLHAIARAVPQCVEGLGFFVDRRGFRPMLAVASVTTSTTGPFLEAVVGALDSFRGEEWTVDAVSLLRLSFGDDATGQTEYRSIRVGRS